VSPLQIGRAPDLFFIPVVRSSNLGISLLFPGGISLISPWTLTPTSASMSYPLLLSGPLGTPVSPAEDPKNL
jgi:hypothetical protein